MRQEKEINIQIGYEETKLSLCTDDMITCVENLEESTKILLELISDYNKAAGYKVNIQKSITFLYTSDEQVKFEIKKPHNAIFISTPKSIILKYNPTKYV